MTLTECLPPFQASGLKAVTLQEAKVLLKDDDDLIIAVYDYWLNKRLRLAHALIPQVRAVRFAVHHHCRLHTLFCYTNAVLHYMFNTNIYLYTGTNH